MNNVEKMLQFLTINTKQQPVNPGVAQHIMSRFTDMLDVEKVPYLPSWVKKKRRKVMMPKH